MFTVTVTLQAEGNEPVEMNYARNVNEIGAAHAVIAALNNSDDSPFAPALLSITVTVNN